MRGIPLWFQGSSRQYARSLIGQLAYVTQVLGTRCVDINQVVVRVARRCVGSGVKRLRLRLVQSRLQPSSLLARQRQVCNLDGIYSLSLMLLIQSVPSPWPAFTQPNSASVRAELRMGTSLQLDILQILSVSLPSCPPRPGSPRSCTASRSPYIILFPSPSRGIPKGYGVSLLLLAIPFMERGH